MQTFLPYPDFWQSLDLLDYKRQGKQRVEAYQILRTLAGQSQGWRNHPAVRMWKGYEQHLVWYGITCCTAWTKRGYKDNLQDKFMELSSLFPEGRVPPPWFGDERIHSSHRSNLLRKDPSYYGKFGWSEPDNLPYYWPL